MVFQNGIGKWRRNVQPPETAAPAARRRSKRRRRRGRRRKCKRPRRSCRADELPALRAAPMRPRRRSGADPDRPEDQPRRADELPPTVARRLQGCRPRRPAIATAAPTAPAQAPPPPAARNAGRRRAGVGAAPSGRYIVSTNFSGHGSTKMYMLGTANTGKPAGRGSATHAWCRKNKNNINFIYPQGPREDPLSAHAHARC